MAVETQIVSEDLLTFGEQFLAGFRKLANQIQNNSGYFLWNLLVCVIIFFAAKGLLVLISRGTKHIIGNEKYHRTVQQGRRIDTIMTLTRSVARYAMYFVAIIAILNQLGLSQTGNLAVALAGVGSLAIGFGAKGLVEDVVTGFFMMFENQFSVGDYIKTDEAEGTVEATAMRVTYLRSLKGDKIIIPNGSIERVINYTRGGYTAGITVPTAYEADTRKVLDVIGRAVTAYAEENGELIDEPPVVQGITAFSSSSVDIGVICKVRPMKQWEVERGMRLAVKEQFDREGYEFPYPRQVNMPHRPPEKKQLTSAGSHKGREIPEWASADDDDDK